MCYGDITDGVSYGDVISLLYARVGVQWTTNYEKQIIAPRPDPSHKRITCGISKIPIIGSYES